MEEEVRVTPSELARALFTQRSQGRWEAPETRYFREHAYEPLPGYGLDDRPLMLEVNRRRREEFEESMRV